MEYKLTDEDFNRLVRYIYDNYGIVLSNKRVLVEGRLANIVQSKGFPDFSSYVRSMFSDPGSRELSLLINKLTTNHTFFMREPKHFEYVKSVVLPYIESTSKDHDVRIWSAACSTGEEPYTLAMIIDEYFGIKKPGWDLRILATDIDTEVLEKGSNAIYSEDAVKTLPERWIKNYFIKLPDGKYQVCDKIRKEVVFKQFNLMDKIIYKKPYDLILCRNVMIYFDVKTKDALVERFYDASKIGAYLFIGHAENISKTTRYSYIQPAIYQKK